MDFNFTGWSVYDSLKFEFTDNTTLNYSEAKKYKSVIAIRLGAEYKYSRKLDLRAGIAYDQSPVKDGYLSPELPDANQRLLTPLKVYFNDGDVEQKEDPT